MSLRAFGRAWNSFFFTPQSPIPVSVFRILYGLCVVATVSLLHSDWLNWFGVHSWMTWTTMTKVEPGARLDIFSLLPQNDAWVEAFFWFTLISALLLTLGLLTRLSSIATFLCVTSIQQRNLFIWHSGDTFLRVAGFFLMFAPAGAALSLDRLLRVRAGKEGAEIRPISPWAQRMIQIELAILYFTAFCWKSEGAPWVDGTALYYAAHLNSIHRFPLPSWFGQPWFGRLGSWFTLALEFALGTLIWFKEVRYPLLLTGLLFHLFLEYAFNIPLFQWDILSAYVLFVDPSDIQRGWSFWFDRRADRLRA